MRKSVCLLLFFLTVLSATAQEKKERKWTLNGYIKDMASYSVVQDDYLTDNLIHNRLNFKWYPFRDVRIVAEMRNRLFIGDRVRQNPFFSELSFSNVDDYWSMSRYWEDSSRAVLHIMLDRLYFQYTLKNLEMKLGRQRINWGINMAWNPNDIFNAFSYFDFDYEERPGSDALLLKYYTGNASSIEIAGKMADSLADFTGGALWKINVMKYDIQLLTGISNKNLVAGAGWAGNIKKAGFKGEGSYFYPLENARDSKEALVGTISLEYSFKNSLYLIGSILYSSNGTKSPSAIEQVLYYSGNISAKYLSPYTWSGFINAAYQFHPLVNGGLSVIGYPGSSDAFLNPNISLSLKQNLDLNLIAQLLFNKAEGAYGVSNQLYYLRLKFSF
jgi:hypothetical protein